MFIDPVVVNEMSLTYLKAPLNIYFIFVIILFIEQHEICKYYLEIIGESF